MREGGGWRGVKAHLEARDGAEFHEQHLEFQLHHASQTLSGPQRREVGDGCWSDHFESGLFGNIEVTIKTIFTQFGVGFKGSTYVFYDKEQGLVVKELKC